MRITRSSTVETAGGPEDWFTGTVFVDTVATPSRPTRHVRDTWLSQDWREIS